ncbi:MAG: hypothetical protein ACLUE1_04365 [Adlercreutzia equolifaciens]
MRELTEKGAYTAPEGVRKALPSASGPVAPTIRTPSEPSPASGTSWAICSTPTPPSPGRSTSASASRTTTAKDIVLATASPYKFAASVLPRWAKPPPRLCGAG